MSYRLCLGLVFVLLPQAMEAHAQDLGAGGEEAKAVSLHVQALQHHVSAYGEQ